ncbi:MAG: L,D-transpeptidase [Candidatus Omnitrophica bacterium]|nr:L,D-transpeptidase [Candidatus Omnitrophota bacterium]
MEKKILVTVNISKQKLLLYSDKKRIKEYKVSTSKVGIGNKYGTNKTPLGKHIISNKIGRVAKCGAIFKKRRNTGRIAKINKDTGDLITSRILRLKGLEKGVNKGKNIDTFKRCVYIHGTPEERLIGKPASHGCIRMKNRDIIDLFKRVKKGVMVNIKKTNKGR